ncbi:ras association domain-containing protein 8-like [Brachionichthys hirsutus]|uniref:ras association domain-containing protein 8-like n=1 Tax=Brachionichthys hirsutus TaxID=412623 RepID=UPI003604907C
MELKVWVDGVQRVVCGVTEATTCQEVVIALAQAIGRTGRYTLVEKWRDAERHLAPHESPVASLNTWGQYASDVQLILHRTGPSMTERPPSEGPPLRGPERGLHRQSLPPLAKLRHPSDRSLRRREPRRKSLTFTGAPRGLREILSGGRIGEADGKQRHLLGNSGNHQHAAPPTGNASPGLWACRMEDLARLVGLQKETLNVLERKLSSYEAELQAWAEGRGGREILKLEKHLKRNEVEMEEEEFWATELQIELESERQLEERLQELRARLQGCELDVGEKLAVVQRVEAGLEEVRLQREEQKTQRVSKVEAQARVVRVKAELKVQERQAVQLESSSRAVDRSLGQNSKRVQDMQHELQQLTKELRQVNLQQFIKQTGTKVTVLPAEPPEEEGSSPSIPLTGSLKRPGPTSSHTMSSRLRVLHSPLGSGLNPEGIYV